MPDRYMLYNIIYALAAQGGRDKALFGSCSRLAFEAFSRSLASDTFPELWFELPLAGDPWFDLHALTSWEDVAGRTSFDPGCCGGCPEAFAWFAAQNDDVRQLALSWDVSSGEVEHPAVQLLMRRGNPSAVCEFLNAAGKPEAAPSYRAFFDRIPKDWFACYAGVFPQREGHHLRVECVPHERLQRAYAEDASLLERHLKQTGLPELGDTLVERCQLMAGMPFQFELQFDVQEDGSAGPTISASSRFANQPGTDEWAYFDPQGAAGELMRRVESWGLADERWPLLAQAAYAQRLTLRDASSLIYCFPAFLKLRWRHGEPVDAKAYLKAGVDE